jgi:hypothetical protein
LVCAKDINKYYVTFTSDIPETVSICRLGIVDIRGSWDRENIHLERHVGVQRE